MIKQVGLDIDDVLWSKIKSKASLEKKSLKEYIAFVLSKEIKK